MNRAICLQRPEASSEDMLFTGQNIIGEITSAANLDLPAPSPTKLSRENSRSNRLKHWLLSVSNSFHYLYSNQRRFFGDESR